ncbi:hypothetical protein BDW02DRAFT_102061 [Decorospora gaudefroyi]|uniref:Uncharacterized protein n=1 Tax=Decorospora gaudefroyi TaxID=184978 RepID=A0A6A5K6J2_9PLEO|nr:hypothetical protein BDW02DRAFT_102061 [Decorospora gaudefroyi]
MRPDSQRGIAQSTQYCTQYLLPLVHVFGGRPGSCFSVASAPRTCRANHAMQAAFVTRALKRERVVLACVRGCFLGAMGPLLDDAVVSAFHCVTHTHTTRAALLVHATPASAMVPVGGAAQMLRLAEASPGALPILRGLADLGVRFGGVLYSAMSMGVM